MRRAATVGLLLFASCAGDNALSGSVGELFSLEVSSTEITRNDEALQVTYLANRGPSLDVVARVRVALVGVDYASHKKFDLQGEYIPGHLRTTVDHQPGGEPVRLFPDVQKGDMVISQGGEVGQLTSGNFSMLFDPDGGDFGQGRTLVGTFAGVAKDGGFGVQHDGGLLPDGGCCGP